jgi:undecaprenyl diphosphate synthase
MLESIAFIPDGNRRYAQQAGINLAESYYLGTQKAWDVLEWLTKYPKIRVGTFYTFSLKNFDRSRLELSVLMKIFEKELDSVKKKKIIEEQGIQLNFLGQKEKFPKIIQKKMLEAEKYTSQFNGKTVNLALGYDGQTEIVEAAKKFAQDTKIGKVNPSELSIDSFRKYLYADFKEPDLIVRTSNQQRLSGFLTFQSSYSGLAFIDKYWPALTEHDVDTLIEEYNSRERRFGK